MKPSPQGSSVAPAAQIQELELHSDQDKGDGSLKYILSGDGAGTLFIIDEKTGDIHATRRIDREEKAFYTLRAQAINRRTLRPVEPESEFVIKIHDINDNEPTFPEEIYTASVPEMSVVGTSVVQVTATDADDPSYGNSARVIYSILQGQPYFSVEPETGIIRTALPNMNRENREQYQVVIQAKDMGGQMGGLSGTTTVNITLTDVNDNPPRFSQIFFLELSGSKHHINCSSTLSEVTLPLRWVSIFQVKKQSIEEDSDKNSTCKD
ncbi:cadherin-10-like [Macrotis lagotis]|uniref:cadherin-10-like n=1 Tax=Macrotis lagotis TaxID=92651 RepID=UPI003D68C6C5